MVPVLVAAAVAAAGGAAFYVYKHWDEIKAWFSKFLTNLKAAIKEKMRGIANAAVIVGQKIREGVAQLKHRLFYKEDGKWIQETALYSRQNRQARGGHYAGNGIGTRTIRRLILRR